MADYLLLFSGGTMPATQEEQEAVMKAWTDWFGQLGGAVKDQGNPFTPGAMKMLGPDGSVSDGAVATTASGYTIIEAESLDRAAELAKGCPVLQGGASISVYETSAVM
jgi:hypothetical protein